MRFLFALIAALMVVGCSGKGPNSASAGGHSEWPTKWCQATPGMSKAQLVAVMGKPTSSFDTAMSWSDDHYQFNAFFNEESKVSQLDINESSLSDAEKAALQCKRARSLEGMEAAQQSAVATKARPACEMIPAAQMSAILGSTVSAEQSGAEKCVYTSAGGRGPYVEFSYEVGDGEAGMAGAAVAGASQKGVASEYDGVGDKAFAAGPALFIRTGDDLVTLVMTGVKERKETAKKVLAAAKAAS